jgi:GPH family glycoside/pentoside/hexuronide:cation symporter
MAMWSGDKVSTDSASTDEQSPPLRTDVFYAMVSLGSTTIWWVLGGWMLYFYLPPEGETLVPPKLLWVVFAVRAANALLAAPIGYISDRTHSRWGRRLPYMFASALPMLILFVLVWTPPVRGESIWNLAYLVPVFLLYNLAYSVNQITYTALLPELALTDRHRVRMSAWSSSFFLLGMVAGGLVGLLIDHTGYVVTALIYAGAVLPLFYLPFLVLRERPERQDAAPERTTLGQSIAAILRNRAFLVMTGAGILYWSTTAFVQGVIPYIVTQVCGLSEADTTLFYIPALGASLLCYPVITWLTHHQGKWRVFAGSLFASAVVLPGLMLVGDWIPISLKAQGIAWITLQAIAMSGVTMLPAAFGAEITDYDAELSGERREGTFYATWGLLDQAINAAAGIILPQILLLGRSRTDPYGPLGVRLVGPIGGVLMLVAFLIFLRYPLRHRSSPREKTS